MGRHEITAAGRFGMVTQDARLTHALCKEKRGELISTVDHPPAAFKSYAENERNSTQVKDKDSAAPHSVFFISQSKRILGQHAILGAFFAGTEKTLKHARPEIRR
ncbi:hypothetical protein GJ744_003522 [Endocarpon pusillum]|uniref:Uncharacterized protein n=1 Tax=Endocarpon pusillum TaxID=364733 RepID=A0A8H7ARN5_9EURO|nr:hypothetical protein GJ744_003522 [Endocarpon pusillum]